MYNEEKRQGAWQVKPDPLPSLIHAGRREVTSRSREIGGRHNLAFNAYILTSLLFLCQIFHPTFLQKPQPYLFRSVLLHTMPYLHVQ